MKELFNKVSESVAERKEKMLDSIEESFSFDKLSEKIGGMTDSAKEKSVTFMNDMIALSPVIDEIGFKTVGISVSIGLPPDVTFHFEKTKDIAPEKRDAILEQHKGNKMLALVTKTLLTADSYQQKLNMRNFRFANIDVCVGLTGGVSFQLVPRD